MFKEQLPISLETREYDEFWKKYRENKSYKHMRVGQAFHQHFELQKVTSPMLRIEFDKLYQLDDTAAKAKILDLFTLN